MSTAGDSAAWPAMMSSDPRATIPADVRVSIEIDYVRLGPTRWCPPPPRPAVKVIAVALLLSFSGLVALTYMALATGSQEQEQSHAETPR